MNWLRRNQRIPGRDTRQDNKGYYNHFTQSEFRIFEKKKRNIIPATPETEIAECKKVKPNSRKCSGHLPSGN